MSDAITLDVLSSSPVQLDVGDADPIAREEIAALATRVTTAEGDISALDGRMDTAEGDISTLGTTVDGIDARVEAIEADYMTAEDVMGALGGEAPALVAGSSCAILGDPETASWMERTTAADGAALIESICGNTTVESGSLLPVRMEGMETVGFNQWDEQWEVGEIADATGQNSPAAGRIRAKNFIPCFANTSYYLQSSLSTNDLQLYYYDADKGYIGHTGWLTNGIITTPSGCRYMRFATGGAYGATYKHDICINISDPARNGTYEPHWSSQRTVPAATYFPDGLRSTGSVRDELRADAAITRVGAVDLGTLTWGNPVTGVFNAVVSDMATSVAYKVTSASHTYATDNFNWASVDSYADKSISTAGNNYVYVKDTSYDSAAAFKAAMSGVMLHYALATPTTTPIDPPLPLSYRVGAGGTERVMVASGTTSAPPVFATRYPLDPADLAASLAPRESATAEANHAVGDLIMLGWTLCKATQVIVTGEVIEIGTNVTRTSVAAEIAALS